MAVSYHTYMAFQKFIRMIFLWDPLSTTEVTHWAASLWKSSSYANFVERISDALIHSNQMVSLDVVSLFTKVPTEETLAVVRDKLAADPLLEERTCIPIYNLMEMMTFCVEKTYFGMGSDIKQQEEGLAMGLSSVLENIHGILWRNGIRIYITKVIYVA